MARMDSWMKAGWAALVAGALMAGCETGSLDNEGTISLAELQGIGGQQQGTGRAAQGQGDLDIRARQEGLTGRVQRHLDLHRTWGDRADEVGLQGAQRPVAAADIAHGLNGDHREQASEHGASLLPVFREAKANPLALPFTVVQQLGQGGD